MPDDLRVLDGPVQPSDPSIAILTPCFFPPEQKTPNIHHPLWGGGERYLIDLARLLTSAGFDVQGFQPSAAPYTVDLWGVIINGMGVLSSGPYEFAHYPSKEFMKKSSAFTYRIYLNVDVSTAATPDSITVTHGVYWDQSNPMQGYRRNVEDWSSWMYQAHTRSRVLVSVDANGINWARAKWGDHVSNKMRYIPNYADSDEYPLDRAMIPPGKRRNDNRMRVLFPRRLVPMRGLDVAINAAYQLLENRKNVEFRFVGKGPPFCEEKVNQLLSQFPDRVTKDCIYMDGMAEEYLKSDIVLIPTQNCEGTSLSCIEAMAAGCAIVGTNAGGISNLLIDRVNGFMTDVNEERFIKALEELLDNPFECATLGAMARKVYECGFTKSLWEARWLELLHELKWL